MPNKPTFNMTHTVTVHRQEKTADGLGTRRVEDGVVIADLDIIIDFDYLTKTMGDKAVRSKRKVSRALHGAITIKAKNLRGGA